MRIVMLGRQGAGKGTQSARLALRLGLAHIATGDIFRSAMTKGSDLGRRVGSFVAAGELVPDELAVEVVAEALNEPALADSGFVLDGFPRTVCQAQRLEALLAPVRIDVVVDLVVEPNVALGRLLSRRVCVDCGTTGHTAPNAHGPVGCDVCGGVLRRRDDDTEPLIRRRLALYEEQTRPLLNWFAAGGILRTVDGRGPLDIVGRRIDVALAAGRPSDEGRSTLSRLASESESR